MSERKNLIINTDLLDARNLREESYTGYESITVNADCVLVTEESKEAFNRLGAVVNTDRMLVLPADRQVEVKTVNGSYTLTGETALAENTLLIVNGALTVAQGTEDQLKRLVSVTVNGILRCPKSLEGYLTGAAVNGAVQVYPDEAVLLDSDFTLDEYFPLRAREGALYYAATRVVIPEEKTDLARLAAKQVRFDTPALVVPEALVETAAPLFGENTRFTVIPAGLRYVPGGTELSLPQAERLGKRLYVDGDLRFADDEVIPYLEKLVVKGTVRLRGSQREAFRQLDAEAENVELRRRTLGNGLRFTVDRSLLELESEGVRVENAAKVSIAADVEPERIARLLELRNIAKVECEPEQKSAVDLVSKNVAVVSVRGEDPEETEKGLLGTVGEAVEGAMGMLKNLKENRMINADHYVM